jgi:hypothetical protein
MAAPERGVDKRDGRGLYLENTPPPCPGGEKKYQPMSFGQKNMKGEVRKWENVKEIGRKGKKGIKGERKRENGK